jgi:endogenous inhibitor of DNA gyrase (YacG/DUF329 family)
MGIHTPSFNCPHCARMIGQGIAGPNWTVVGMLGDRDLVIISCPHCQKAIGAM